jgi:hypothetical protein
MDEVNYIIKKYNFNFDNTQHMNNISVLINEFNYIYLTKNDIKGGGYCDRECECCDFHKRCASYTLNVTDVFHMIRKEKLKRILE